MKKIIATLTATLFFSMSMMMPAAQAGIVSTSDYVQQQDVADKRARIIDTLQREEVREQLSDLGVDAATVEMRVAALSDAEVMQMASEMESMPAGGDGVGTVAFILLVLLLLELLGVTDIFPDVDSA